MIELTALLPMKKISERIPNKNFKIFNGKPLYQWILTTLLSISYIKKIIINTDAIDIISNDKIIRDEQKIILRDRDKNICGNKISMNKIIENDLRFNGAGLYLMTHTTNPLLSSSTIKKGIEYFIKKKEENNYDSLFSVNKHQSRFFSTEIVPINHSIQNLIPTQDLNPLFEENSNFYIFDRDCFNKNFNRIGNKPLMFQTPFFESIDIDTRLDWRLAELFKEETNES